MTTPAMSPADRVAAAYDATIEAHERLLEAFVEWVSTDPTQTMRSRRRWLRWADAEAAAVARLRRDNPYRSGASS
jgi:hypothetical protein